jgi:hypothetical protein
VTDFFPYAMMALNAGAAVTYGVQGHGWKSLYWCAACVLNLCVVRMREPA